VLCVTMSYFLWTDCTRKNPRVGDFRTKSGFMEYEETYHGHCIIITTLQGPEGNWTSRAELLDSGRRIPVTEGSGNQYQSEEEARQAALSMGAAAIDRARISKGKP